MKAALLPDRGVVKVVGDGARKFLDGLVTNEVEHLSPGQARFAALLTPQGKIIVDFIITEAEPADGGGFFLDCPRALAPALVQKLNFYKLRAKVIVEDLSETLAVMAVWDGTGATEFGLGYPDPRLASLGGRIMLPQHLASEAAADLGATLVDADEYDRHRITQGVPRGGIDFAYSDAFPHETDMDQLSGVDFKKGCFIGQEVVSRMEHRGTARTRIVPVVFDGPSPENGAAIKAGEKALGTMGSAAAGHGLASLRLDRVNEALESGLTVEAGGIPIHVQRPSWAKFAVPTPTRAAE